MADSAEKPKLEAIQTDLESLKKTVEFQKDIHALQADLQRELNSIRKDFSDLRTEVKVESNFYKWVGASGFFVAIVLGALGISQWRDIIGKLKSEVDQTSEYQSNLARGLALVNGNHPQDAVQFLSKCYDVTPKDEVVAAALLHSYQEGDQWDKAVPVANQLIKTEGGVDNIKDNWVINDIGRSLLYQGRSDISKLKEAETYLQRAAANLKGDSQERDVWINLWVLYLFNDDISKAEKSLRSGNEAMSTKGQWGSQEWKKQTDWSLFRYLEENNRSMSARADQTIADVIK